MTQSASAYTNLADSAEAGARLGAELAHAFGGEPPHAAVVFASARYDYRALLVALEEACRPDVLVGCSSAGEFIREHQGEASACALGLRSTDIQFAAGLGTGLQANPQDTAQMLTQGFQGTTGSPSRFHAALVLTDALAGRADDLIERLNVETGGGYRFFGGGAGDDARFAQTHVFFGTQAYTDAAVALEMISSKPIGIGVEHGWEPASAPFRVTSATGMCLHSLDGYPAVEAIQAFAEETSQPFDPSSPLSFFLLNVLGIEVGGSYKLRVPLAVNEDGSINCAAEIPEGALLYIMRASNRSAIEAAATATRSALSQLQDSRPEAAFFFDCVATRLRMGQEFGLELSALERSLGAAKYAGCNTYGQIARVPAQFSGFHNCTAVVCVIPA